MNEVLKKEIKAARLYNYEIAEQLGISEPTFYRMLRKELSPRDRELITNAIKRLIDKRTTQYQ